MALLGPTGGSPTLAVPEPKGLPNLNRKRHTGNNNNGSHKTAPSSGLVAPTTPAYTNPGGLAALPSLSPYDTAQWYAQLQSTMADLQYKNAALRAQRVGVKAALQPMLADIKTQKIQGLNQVREQAIGQGLYGGSAELEQEIGVRGQAASARAEAKTGVIGQLQQLKLENQYNTGQMAMTLGQLQAAKLAGQETQLASALANNTIISGGEVSADTYAKTNGVDLNSDAFKLAPNRQGKVITAAESVIGAPYNSIGDFNPPGAAGGAGTAFDCSGLTEWVASKVGVQLPHDSTQQYAMLPHVSAANLQAGDLVFFSYGRKGPGVVDHVGIYKGNGQMIVANSPGGSVQVQDVNWAAFVGGGRFITAGKKG